MGGIARHSPDSSASGLAIFLFFLGALGHLFIFSNNKKHRRAFKLSLLVAGKTQTQF